MDYKITKIFKITSIVIILISILIYMIQYDKLINLNINLKNLIDLVISFNKNNNQTDTIIKLESEIVETNTINNNLDDYDFGEEIDSRISLRVIKNLITNEECDHLIKLGESIFKPSEVVEGNGEYVTHSGRTSLSAILHEYTNDIHIQNIINKAVYYNL